MECKPRSLVDTCNLGYPAIANLSDKILKDGLVGVHEKGQA